MPAASAVLGWARDDPEGFGLDYRLARQIGFEILADELLEIAASCEPTSGAVAKASLGPFPAGDLESDTEVAGRG